MKKLFFFFCGLCLLLLLAPLFFSWNSDDLISNINAQAEWDPGAFKAHAAKEFGVPVANVENLIRQVGTPGDAYICLRVGQIAAKPVDVVAQEYASHGKSWKIIAKKFGIMPGSKEFRAIKRAPDVT